MEEKQSDCEVSLLAICKFISGCSRILTNEINITANPYTVVVAHTHTVSVVYKMFSAPDILKMASIAKLVQSNNVTTVDFLEITHILVLESCNGIHKMQAFPSPSVLSLGSFSLAAHSAACRFRCVHTECSWQRIEIELTFERHRQSKIMTFESPYVSLAPTKKKRDVTGLIQI